MRGKIMIQGKIRVPCNQTFSVPAEGKDADIKLLILTGSNLCTKTFGVTSNVQY
jgi:hypothetical protein